MGGSGSSKGVAHGGVERSPTLKDDDDPGQGHFALLKCWLVIF